MHFFWTASARDLSPRAEMAEKCTFLGHLPHGFSPHAERWCGEQSPHAERWCGDVVRKSFSACGDLVMGASYNVYSYTLPIQKYTMGNW